MHTCIDQQYTVISAPQASVYTTISLSDMLARVISFQEQSNIEHTCTITQHYAFCTKIASAETTVRLVYHIFSHNWIWQDLSKLRGSLQSELCMTNYSTNNNYWLVARRCYILATQRRDHKHTFANPSTELKPHKSCSTPSRWYLATQQAKYVFQHFLKCGHMHAIYSAIIVPDKSLTKHACKHIHTTHFVQNCKC